MRLLALAALAAAAGGAVVFVWLFGSGAVFGQEAAAWPTTEAIVRARILGDDLVKLSADPEKYVATGTANASTSGCCAAVESRSSTGAAAR